MQDTIAQPSTPVAADTGLGRRIVRAAGWTFIWLGALTLGFVAHQLWVTTYFAQQAQSGLSEERLAYYEEVEVSEAEYIPLVEDGSGNLVPGAGGELPTILVEAPPEEGEPFALIRIPKLAELQEGWTLVEGVTISLLRSGAGHMPTTPLPGQPGNSVISGHRTTYGAPFHNLDQLMPGDRIEVETALGLHVYEVREMPFVVEPTALWVTEPKPGGWLTLTTCHPKFSAAERLIVQAELVEGPNFAAISGTQ